MTGTTGPTRPGNRGPGPAPELDCAAARPLIEAYLLDELGEADGRRLAGHLRDCPACSAELGGATRLVGLLAALPTPAPAPDLDERIILAAIADRRRRHEHRSWLADLRLQVLRGAMRTTGTLVVTVVTVALLGSAFVFAASQFVTQFPAFTSRATMAPEVTPTLAPTPEQTAVPTAPPGTGTSTPAGVVATPTIEPTPVPREPTPAPTEPPAPTPAPTQAATPEPTPEPTASPEPTPAPTPTPTKRPRPTPSPSSSPSDSAAPSATPTPSP
jgi:hypothetical protein